MKKQEIKFIYNSKKKQDREAFGLITALDKHIINEFDTSKDRMTETQLAELAHKLSVSFDDLFDPNSDQYSDKFKSISDEDKLLVINTDMSLLKTPIVVRSDGTATVLKSPFEIHPLDLEIDGTKNNRF